MDNECFTPGSAGISEFLCLYPQGPDKSTRVFSNLSVWRDSDFGYYSASEDRNWSARLSMQTVSATVAREATPAAMPRPSGRAAASPGEAVSHARQMRTSVMMRVRMVRRQERSVRSGCRPGSLLAFPVTFQPARRISTENTAAADATMMVMPMSSQECGSSRCWRMAGSWADHRA
jgi:hypothetical protein